MLFNNYVMSFCVCKYDTICPCINFLHMNRFTLLRFDSSGSLIGESKILSPGAEIHPYLADVSFCI